MGDFGAVLWTSPPFAKGSGDCVPAYLSRASFCAFATCARIIDIAAGNFGSGRFASDEPTPEYSS